MKRQFLMVCFCLVVSACSRGPDTATLKDDVEARLNQVFGENTLTVTQLVRRGSSKDTDPSGARERLMVYFDADLKLKQAHDFSAWDSPGTASLLSALGAGPRGIRGIVSGGNQPDDVLRAHGSLIYQRESGGWQVLTAQGFTQPAMPALERPEDTSPLVSAMSTALNLDPAGGNTQTRKIIKDELSRAMLNIQGRIARLEQGYALAAGPSFGQYSRFSIAFSALLNQQGIKLVPQLSEGGVENLRMLRQGNTQLALSQSDVAYEALWGTGLFTADGANPRLRALAALYPEPVHVVVRSDGPTSIDGLRGRRVNLGLPGSASRETTLAVLAANDLSISNLAGSTELDLPAALVALRDGQIDALIQVIGAPADAIAAASDSVDLRFLPLSPQALAHLVANRPGVFAYTLPIGSYPGQSLGVSTLAVSSLLLTEDEALSGLEAEQLVRLMFESGEQWLSLGSVQGTQLSLAKALKGLDIPVHPGVVNVLRGKLDLAQPDSKTRLTE
jgi:TRAP transporter TAXI family solute receptor